MQKTQRRLLRQTPRIGSYLGATGAVGVATALVVIAQASLLAGILTAGFTGGAHMSTLTVPLVALAGVVAARALLAWLQGFVAQRAAGAVKSRLRERLLARTQEIGPVRLARWRRGELATLVTRGLDGLDPYFTGYLPKLVLAAVLPVAVLTRLAIADWSSALIIAVTLPLIPIFAILVGSHTRERTARQWRTLSRLGGHFLDVVTGLPTLRAFGRARAQVEVVRRMADAYRAATLRTLRVAFLSAMVLELVATLSVALVAVPVGLRLMGGGVALSTALLVLLLAPEAYLPLRAAGSAFHTSMDGVAVAERAFAVLDTDISEPEETPAARAPARPVDTTRAVAGSSRAPARQQEPGRVPDPGVDAIRLEQVAVRYPDRDQPALDNASLRIVPGQRIALIGPSGAGKSTLLALLLGFVSPGSGRVLAGNTDLNCLDHRGWWRWRNRLAWMPGRPHLFAGTVADNIRLGRPDATAGAVREAAGHAGADEFVAQLPHAYDTSLGERGLGLSAGQRQRIALARAFLRDAPLLLLDEPTAHLDPASEATVVEATARLMTGRTAVVVTHRPALVPHVDRIIRVADGQVHDTTTHPQREHQVSRLARPELTRH